MIRHRRGPGERPLEQDLSRIGAFSDGVLAIAVTLLVLNIDVPQLSRDSMQELPGKLVDLWPDLLAYALSFAVIGRYWIVHHRIFGMLRAVDGRFITLNLTFLGLTALMPFTTEVLARYGDQPAATMSYGTVIALASFATWSLVNYAKRHDLVKPVAAEAARRFGTLQALALPAVFALSVPLALWDTRAAQAAWVASFLVHPSRLGRSRSSQHR